jgi:alkylation response protein AidB-like acyl-CoA dehydrogenase
MDSFQIERLAGGVLSLGAMDGMIQMTLQYMQEREAFGRPISKYQALRHRMADLMTEVEACRQLAYNTVWLFTQGEFAVKECSMLKLHATELQKKVADECLQMFGGYGYMEDYPICRAYRDTRVGTIAGGTSEIMREIIAKMAIDDVKYAKAY